MAIIRVFPGKTSMTPTDSYSFVGDPPFFRPAADEVHISVTFTWDISEGYRLREAWGQYYDHVKIGGPAINGSDGEFIPGKYLKRGITITSRGCLRKCPWCFVPNYEGKIKPIKIRAGCIIQDNNILAAPRKHQEKVYSMLRKLNKPAKFSGGIDSRLVDNWVSDQFRNIKIGEVFLAADSIHSLKPLAKAVDILSFLGKNSNKMRCFVMIGFNGETIPEAKERLQEVWDIGCLPFSQLYQPPDKKISYSKEWKDLNRNWSRPAIIRTMMKANNGE